MEFVSFKEQHYNELVQQHDCYNLFEDPLFPCNNRSLFYSKSGPPKNIEWRRPKVSSVLFIP